MLCRAPKELDKQKHREEQLSNPTVVLVHVVSQTAMRITPWLRRNKTDFPDPIPLLHIQTIPIEPAMLGDAGLCIGKSVQGKETPL